MRKVIRTEVRRPDGIEFIRARGIRYACTPAGKKSCCEIREQVDNQHGCSLRLDWIVLIDKMFLFLLLSHRNTSSLKIPRSSAKVAEIIKAAGLLLDYLLETIHSQKSPTSR